MYSGWGHGSALSNEWIEQTNRFLDHAFSINGLVISSTIRCPCAMCRNYVMHKRNVIEMHLCKYGFKENYKTWTSHGETIVRQEGHASSISHEGFDEVDHIDNMLVDLGAVQPPIRDEEPTPSVSAFYKMVASADELVHDNTMHSSLSAVARLLALKSEFNMSIAHYDSTLKLIHELLPPGSKLAEDFYHSKKLL